MNSRSYRLTLLLLLLAPVARAQLQVDAGPDQVVTTLEQPPDVVVQLAGAVTPATAQVVWSYASGHGRPRFRDATRAMTTATFTETGPITLRLTATLGSQTASDTMTVTTLVPALPVDNLVRNPWFRDATGTTGSMAGWTVAGGWWTATRKGHNPSPDLLAYTAADLNPKGGAGDTFFWQVVAADRQALRLRFRLNWVTISMIRVYVRILGGDSSTGPWTEVWVPFSKANAHTVRWGQTSLLETRITRGWAHYRIELHGVIGSRGGTKYDGVYFTALRDGQGAASYGPFGSGCAGIAGIPALAPVSGSRPLLGGNLRARYSGLPSTGRALVHVLGLTRGLSDLTPTGMPGCTLYLTPDVLVLLSGGGTSVDWQMPIPTDSALVGAVFHNQGLVAELPALRFSLSNAARGIVGSR